MVTLIKCLGVADTWEEIKLHLVPKLKERFGEEEVTSIISDFSEKNSMDELQQFMEAKTEELDKKVDGQTVFTLIAKILKAETEVRNFLLSKVN